jgi:hypothetical protein
MTNVSVFAIAALAPTLVLIGLLVIGIAVVTIRSAIEANGPRVVAALRRWHTRARAWLRSHFAVAMAPDLPASRLSRSG